MTKTNTSLENFDLILLPENMIGLSIEIQQTHFIWVNEIIIKNPTDNEWRQNVKIRNTQKYRIIHRTQNIHRDVSFIFQLSVEFLFGSFFYSFLFCLSFTHRTMRVIAKSLLKSNDNPYTRIDINDDV